MKTLLRHPEFRVGMQEMSAVGLGLAAWGLMTGVAMAKSGMSNVEVVLMAMFVFAGSSQLAALPLIAGGAPMWVVLATAFCVNLRFVVFSAHVRPYLMHLGFWRRIGLGYFMADMNYALLTQRFPQPGTDPATRVAQEAYILGGGVMAWISWVLPSLLGIALANSIPVAWGLGFAGILALAGITCSMVSSPLRAVAVGVAGTAAVAAFALPFKLNILAAIAAAVAACLMLQKAPGVTGEQAPIALEGEPENHG
jgi:predicted branched-subunit amino acid permease